MFMVPQVAKLIRKEHLPHSALCRAAREVLAGRLGAGESDLGDGLFKKRLARPGGGKSGGYRAIVAYRAPRSERVLFVHAFAKNVASSLTPQGHDALAKIAAVFLVADDGSVGKLAASGEIMELSCDGIREG